MQLYLCSTIGEIQHRLAFPRNPLEIFQIINLYRPQDWRFGFQFDIAGKVTLDIEFGLEENPMFSISSGMLGVFDCDRIEVKHSGAVWNCEWQRGINHRAEQNILEYVTSGSTARQKPAIRLSGFGGGAFPSELSDWNAIETYLQSNTWLGSQALVRERFAVEVAAFDNRTTFRNYSRVHEKLKKQGSQGIPTLLLSQSLGLPVLGEAHLLSTAADINLSFRWTQSGFVARHDLQDKLALDLSTWPIQGELEVTFPMRTLGPDGTLAMDDACQSIVVALNKLGSGLGANAKLIKFNRECAEFEKKVSARRIDQRKDQLQRTNFVYWKNKLVYKVPTNENETVSLHQKLEGMGGIPFAEFVSLEYTPKLGIDAIVNFKISDEEAIHRFATVEFEYKFENFFAHAHPVEQTDMIICWEKTGTSSGQWRYEPDPHVPWLGYLHVSGRVITVAQVSRYPELTFKGI
jgi:hypothetical protein